MQSLKSIRIILTCLMIIRAIHFIRTDFIYRKVVLFKMMLTDPSSEDGTHLDRIDISGVLLLPLK